MIKHNPIVVPGNVRYISDWKDYNFSMTPGRCIIDKKVPGCGFTEFYLTNSENVILCSPRIMLIKNKCKQHNKKTKKIHFAENKYDKVLRVDKDITGNTDTKQKDNQIDSKDKQSVYDQMKLDIKNYIGMRDVEKLPYKILVTYDSYHIVKSILKDLKLFDSFTTMVDEFQTILHDSRFKSDTEVNLLEALSDVEKVHFVSATPMLDRYLEMLSEFKDLDYYTIDWASENPMRIIKPNLDIRIMKSLNSTILPIIKKYKDGEYEVSYRKEGDKIVEVVSDQAVFYVNSVKHIVSIIKRANLKPEECNILCANTPENVKKINQILNKVGDVKERGGSLFNIGDVPDKDEPNKMFTFCTRTVYLGADFYSGCARTFIFSDSNLDCLSVDISQDLPQIMGRQRLDSNPWKDSAQFYFRATANYRKMGEDEFIKNLTRKVDDTKERLELFDQSSEKQKQLLWEDYSRLIPRDNYKYSYVSIGFEDGKKILLFNQLAYVSEIRSFDIQQIDYKDRFSVYKGITEYYGEEVCNKIHQYMQDYLLQTKISERIKFVCEMWFDTRDSDLMKAFLNQFSNDDYAKIAFEILGPERCRALGYHASYIRKELNSKSKNLSGMNEDVAAIFIVGKRYTRDFAKSELQKIYDSYIPDTVAKAQDLDKWFEIKKCLIPENGKRVHGFEIIKKK